MAYEITTAVSCTHFASVFATGNFKLGRHFCADVFSPNSIKIMTMIMTMMTMMMMMIMTTMKGGF